MDFPIENLYRNSIIHCILMYFNVFFVWNIRIIHAVLNTYRETQNLEIQYKYNTNTIQLQCIFYCIQCKYFPQKNNACSAFLHAGPRYAAPLPLFPSCLSTRPFFYGRNSGFISGFEEPASALPPASGSLRSSRTFQIHPRKKCIDHRPVLTAAICGPVVKNIIWK